MAVEIGALRALLSLDSAAFEKGSKRAQASMSKLQRSLSKSAAQMNRVGRTMSMKVTAPIVASAGLLLRSSLKTIDAQSKMAQSLGTSTRSMQVLARAADRAGLSTGELQQVSQQLTKRLSQAATGAGPAAKSLDRLGLSAEDLINLDLDQRIAVINRAIAETVPAAEQAAVAATIFGDRAGLLASRLDANTIAAANDEIERFGLAVSELEADQIEEANDAMSALGLVTAGLGNQLAVALAPTLKDISERLADVGAWFANLDPDMKRFIASAVALAAAIGPLAIALGFIATGLAALASPVGIIIVGLGALGSAAAYVAANWESLTAKYPMLQTALDVVARAAEAAWRVFSETGLAAFDIAKGYIEVFAALLTGDLSGALESAEGISKRFVEYINSAFPGMIDTISRVVDDTLAAGREIAEGIGDGITAGISYIGEAFDGLVDSIIEWIKGIPARVIESAKQVGRDIVSGLAVGMSGNNTEFRSAAQKISSQLVDETEKELEIKSPSRVFMRIGEQLMAGLGVGIADGTTAAAAAAAEAAGQVSEAAQTELSEGQNSVNSFFDSFADAAAGAIVSGENFAENMKRVFQQLARDLLATGLSNILKSIFSPMAAGAPGAAGGGGVGVIGRIVSAVFGGFRAEGGPVSAGRAYVVGERGPELFAPGMSGAVIPNNAMTGGANFTYAPNIDARGADTAAVVKLSEVVARDRQDFAKNVQAVMRNSNLRGR